MNKLAIVLLLSGIFVIAVFTSPYLAGAQGGKNSIWSRELTALERKALTDKTPLVSLISIPEKYSGKSLAVEGYLHNEYEDQRLYLSKEAADHHMTDYAIGVSFAKNSLLLQAVSNEILPQDRDQALHKFDKKYVLLTGQFSPGSLSNVTRILELE